MFIQRLQFKLNIGPNNKQLIQKIQTPLNNLLLLLINIIINSELNKKVKKNLPALILLDTIEHEQFLLVGHALLHLLLQLFEHPLDVDERDVGGDFLI